MQINFWNTFLNFIQDYWHNLSLPSIITNSGISLIFVMIIKHLLAKKIIKYTEIQKNKFNDIYLEKKKALDDETELLKHSLNNTAFQAQQKAQHFYKSKYEIYPEIFKLVKEAEGSFLDPYNINNSKIYRSLRTEDEFVKFANNMLENTMILGHNTHKIKSIFKEKFSSNFDVFIQEYETIIFYILFSKIGEKIETLNNYYSKQLLFINKEDAAEIKCIIELMKIIFSSFQQAKPYPYTQDLFWPKFMELQSNIESLLIRMREALNTTSI